MSAFKQKPTWSIAEFAFVTAVLESNAKEF